MHIYWRKPLAAMTLGVVLLSAQPAQAQDALKFFKNYFITGDYVVGGVGLAGQGVDGIAQGTITINDDDLDGKEIVAAFLYAQVVSADGPEAGAAGVTFHGIPLSTDDGTFAVIGDPEGATPCWSSGGGTGQSNGSKRTYSYRYDVLRYLPVVEGRQQANGAHPVGLPDLGNSNATPIALGASLVLIYRDPDLPLSAFVIYDGSWAMDNATQGMTQTIEGFYDPAPETGELTHIVGSGQANKSENLKVNGSLVQVTVNGTIVGDSINPFQSSEGEAWDNVTVITPNISGADYLITSVDDMGIPSADCLTWSAVIYRTKVNDSDNDGLLNIWETSLETLYDPNDQPLPNLAAMEADPNRKDVFVEIGYMETTGDVTYGAGAVAVTKPKHTHLPTADALTKIFHAFDTAKINVHFDVGNNHQGVPGVILVQDGARGGEAYNEMITVCEPGPEDPPWVCQFSKYPGTVGWKSGFRALRDALISDPEPFVLPEDDHICDDPSNDVYNDGPGGNCERVFDRNRKDMFRYVFFAHALGVPKAHCLDLNGDPETNPNFGLPDPNCPEIDLFHVPNTYTGVGDWGGGDAMVTMGGFDNAAALPVGTDNQQAGTIMHELGHTFMLRHGGAPENPNCGPNYLSIMNYLFQLRGLPSGGLTVDFSGETLSNLNESALVNDSDESTFSTAWYAPFSGIGSPATRHCNGSEIDDGAQMIRVDGTVDVDGPMDWDADGMADSNPFPQDINFNGSENDDLAGFNDWGNLRLNQVGSRRNIGVWFFADGFPYIGPASLDMGRFDFGRFDFGRFDFGRFDFGNMNPDVQGRFDFGRFDFGDMNLGDLGRFDFGDVSGFGRFDFGRFDFGVGAGDLGRGADGKGGSVLGRFDFGRFDFGIGGDGQLTVALAVAAGLFGPPTGLEACVAGHSGDPACAEQDGELRVLLEWGAPDASPSEYLVYRAEEVGGPLTFALVGSVDPADGVNGAFEFVDDTDTLDFATTYVYYVAAKYEADEEVNESASDTVPVTTGPQFYVLVPVRNLPPNRQNTGSAVPVEWYFTLNGVDAFDSSDANPVVTLEGQGIVLAFSSDDIDPGSSDFKLPTADNGWTWQLNLQLKYPDPYPPNPPLAGTDLPGGDYQIKIESVKMEAPRVFGPFGVRAAKGGKNK